MAFTLSQPAAMLVPLHTACAVDRRQEGALILPDSHRILLDDDDTALQRMIRLTLASEGFDVVTAQDGVHALEQLDHGSFDAILLDLQMPVMDGRTFYREMRARGVGTPVIILSAYGANEAREELQAEAAVAKPFDPDDLIALTQRLVETR